LKVAVKINLGCGTKYKNGWINVDYYDKSTCDVVWDLNKYPYPFKKDYADEIEIVGLLNVLNDLERFMDEVARILKPGGIIRIIVPHASNVYAHGAFSKYTFTLNSMNAFDPKMATDPRSNKFEIVSKKLRFQPTHRIFGWFNYLINRFPSFGEKWIGKIIPIDEVEFVLKKR